MRARRTGCMRCEGCGREGCAERAAARVLQRTCVLLNDHRAAARSARGRRRDVSQRPSRNMLVVWLRSRHIFALEVTDASQRLSQANAPTLVRSSGAGAKVSLAAGGARAHTGGDVFLFECTRAPPVRSPAASPLELVAVVPYDLASRASRRVHLLGRQPGGPLGKRSAGDAEHRPTCAPTMRRPSLAGRAAGEAAAPSSGAPRSAQVRARLERRHRRSAE